MSLQIDYTGLKDKMISYLVVTSWQSVQVRLPWQSIHGVNHFPSAPPRRHRPPRLPWQRERTMILQNRSCKPPWLVWAALNDFVKPGQTVAIKPNATWAYPPKTASSTDPDFLAAVIQTVQAAGAGRIIVMDHCSIEPGADEALRINGIGQLVKNLEIEHVFPIASTRQLPCTRK